MRRNRGVVRYVALVVIAGAVVVRAANAPTVKLTNDAAAAVPAPWRQQPSRTRNLTVLVLPSPGNKGPEQARVEITTERRRDHVAAVHRLREIAAEQGGQLRYLDICGWPALDRRSTVELAHVMAAEDDQEIRPTSVVKTTVETVAIAVEQNIIRYEGTLIPSAPADAGAKVTALAQALQCGAKPPAGQTAQELQLLARPQPKPRPAPQPSAPPASESLLRNPKDVRRGGGAPSVQAPALVRRGVGELQIGVDNTGFQVVVGTNTGNSFSTDGGNTFKASKVVKWPGTSIVTKGDPCIGVGASQFFYFSTIVLSTAGCADSVARSLDGGNNWKATGNAVQCQNVASTCFPDQEQMAVDRFNQPSGADQLYMVWRNFPGPASVTACAKITTGNPTPTISCSSDGGTTWINQTAVGSGDIGRPTVGKDGFVYVTYVSGGNLMINKFTSCSHNLTPVGGNFPVTIASISGVNCPVGGLDRCNNAGDASPQPAVDDTNPAHVFVAYADQSGSGENVILRESFDGGNTWPAQTTMNSNISARRFLPWVCVSKGIPYVSWYDRRAGADQTSYWVNFATQGNNSISAGTERNVSGVNDPECATAWPCSVDNANDGNGCPGGTSTLEGRCLNSAGAGSRAPCTFGGPACAVAGESCTPAGGCPKYGDYNGNACTRGGVYLGWASATPPAGVPAPAPGIAVYTDHLNYAQCGASNQPCCFQGASQCNGATLACDPNNNCVTCGDLGSPCCTSAAPSPCHGTLACVNNSCTCGGPNQPCCGNAQTCDPGYTCAAAPGGGFTCQCGNVAQPCCGTTCNSSLLVCSIAQGYTCISACGHQQEPCCHSDPTAAPPPSHTGSAPGWCYGGDTCVNDQCVCGGKDQPCCHLGQPCGAGLTCANLICLPQQTGNPTCNQCTSNLTLCLKGCTTDPHHQALCDCLCQVTACDCRTQNNCALFCQPPTCAGL